MSDLAEALSAHLATLGAQGGKKRMAGLTPKQRHLLASKAAKASWSPENRQKRLNAAKSPKNGLPAPQ